MLVFYLSLWGITLFFPYLRLLFPQIQGECDWNSFGMFYYFGGYFGYVILGYFLHHYNRLDRIKSLVIGMAFFSIGSVLTYLGFIHDQQVFLDTMTSSGVENWKLLEFHINFLSPNVVLMTAGVFMMFQNLELSQTMTRIFKELSVNSYGIFLVHYIICLWVGDLLQGQLMINPGLEQFLFAVFTFLISYGIVKVISFVPKSKYLIG